MKRMRAVAVLLVVATSGCAAAMSANVHHNSRGSACVSSPAFAMIDLLIGFAGTAAIAASEESAGYYVIPGVFFTSGVIGGVSAVRCRGDDDEKIAADPLALPPASNSAPSWNAEVDPDAIDTTTRTIEIVPEEPPAMHPVLKLRLPADYKLTPPVEDTKIPCRDNPSACPPSQTCAIAGDDAGYCR